MVNPPQARKMACELAEAEGSIKRRDLLLVVWGLVWGLGFRVQGAGFIVQGSGLRV